MCLTYLGPAEDIKVEINVRSVEDGEAVQHENLGVGFRRFGEKIFFKCRLFFQGRENIVIIAQDTPAVVV